MCEKNKPSLKKAAGNLAKPMPLRKKIYLTLVNNAAKIIKGSRCCGHSGEPGC